MRWSVRVSLFAALIAGALWFPLRSASADDDQASPKPQLTELQEQRVSQRSQSLAKALGRMNAEDPLGNGPKAPKVGKRVVARGHIEKVSPDGSAPPAVLNDLAAVPGGLSYPLYKAIAEKAPWLTKTIQAVAWANTRPGQDEVANIQAAYDYLTENTSLGKDLKDELHPAVDDNDAKSGRANYADTGDANGVTVILPAIGEHNLGQHWSVTLNQAEFDAPLPARALILGHEIDVHARDVEDKFLDDPSAQMPSELRAFVIDAQNYLEIRSKLEAAGQKELLEKLRADHVWQQADIKARIVLGIPVGLIDYDVVDGDKAGSREAGAAKRAQETAAMKPTAAAREYVKEKYKDSGERGAKMLDQADDSPIGRYNQETDAIIEKLSKTVYPFMNHDF